MTDIVSFWSRQHRLTSLDHITDIVLNLTRILKQGIEVMIMDEVEGITGVVDVTDHAAGTNPFY
jgi:hypothetical protein